MCIQGINRHALSVSNYAFSNNYNNIYDKYKAETGFGCGYAIQMIRFRCRFDLNFNMIRFCRQFQFSNVYRFWIRIHLIMARYWWHVFNDESKVLSLWLDTRFNARSTGKLPLHRDTKPPDTHTHTSCWEGGIHLGSESSIWQIYDSVRDSIPKTQVVLPPYDMFQSVRYHIYSSIGTY